jgi:hypothetical protein
MSLVLFATTLVASYCCIGAAIKLVDDLNDGVRQVRGQSAISLVATMGAAVLADFWIWIDAYSDGLALALLLGLAMARKVDNRYFMALALTTLPFVLLQMFRADVFFLVLPLLLVLAPSAVVDEGLDAISPRLHHAALRLLTKFRPVMKVVVLLLPFWGLLTVFHTIAFWGFDIAYGLVGYGMRAPVRKS